MKGEPPLCKGESLILNWDSSEEAESCQGDGFDTLGYTYGEVQVSPTETTTYQVTCEDGEGNTLTDLVEVEVVDVILEAVPDTIIAGESLILYWDTSEEIKSCQGDGFNTGGQTSGPVDVFPIETTTYGITCEDEEGGTETVSVEVKVVSASLEAQPNIITEGNSSTLEWGSQEAEFCQGAGFDTGGQTSGSADVSPTETTTYQVTCEDEEENTVTDSVTVFLMDVDLTADPETITEGESSTLNWSSDHTISCQGDGFDTGGQTSGSVDVSPSETTTYEITCEDEEEITVSDSVEVTVEEDQTPSRPSGGGGGGGGGGGAPSPSNDSPEDDEPEKDQDSEEEDEKTDQPSDETPGLSPEHQELISMVLNRMILLLGETQMTYQRGEMSRQEFRNVLLRVQQVTGALMLIIESGNN